MFLLALCKSAANVIFAALGLILNCPGLKPAIAVYRGLLIGRPLSYIKNYYNNRNKRSKIVVIVMNY